MLCDTTREVVVAVADLNYRVDTTPYEGFACTGYPVATVSRGEVVWDGRALPGRAGAGRMLVWRV